jgi:pyruvate dehydrogenase E1 component
MGAGTILREVEAAADILEQDYGIAADVWSVTSVNELAREGRTTERSNRLNPSAEKKKAYITECLSQRSGPCVIATDYIRAYSEQLRAFVPERFVVLGTDGYGRSDTRAKLRDFFEVSREWVVLAALSALVDEGVLDAKVVEEAMPKLGISATKLDPMTV